MSARGLWMMVVLLLVGCGAPMRDAAYANAESACAQNPAPCDGACQTDPHGAACAVALVRKGQGIIHGETTPDPSAVLSLHGWLGDLCGRGFSRACATDQDLDPSYARARGTQQASQAAAGQAAQAQDAAKTTISARVDRVREGARAVLGFLGADEASCMPTWNGATRQNCLVVNAQKAGDIIAAVNQVATCGTRCATKLDALEAKLRSLQQDIDDLKVNRAEKGARDAARAACDQDPAACEQECSANAASDKCAVLAVSLSAGEPAHTKGGPKPAVGRDMAKRGCTAGNTLSCKSLDAIVSYAGKCSDLTTCKAYCDAQFADGCTGLATLYINGTGVPESYSTANAILARACAMGSGNGCFKLAAAHIEGIGMPKDLVAGRPLAMKGCDLGVQMSCQTYCEVLSLTQGMAQRMTDPHCARGIPGPVPARPTSSQPSPSPPTSTPTPGTSAATGASPSPGRTVRTTCANGKPAQPARAGCWCDTTGPLDKWVQAPFPTDPSCSPASPRAEGSDCIFTCR